MLCSDLRNNNVRGVAAAAWANAAGLATLSMGGNPTQCLLGITLNGTRDVYCQCAAGFVSLQPSNCIAAEGRSCVVQ